MPGPVGLNFNTYIPPFDGSVQAPPGRPVPQKTEQPPAVKSEGVWDDKVMKRMGITECTTCKNRKYVDGSDDAGVSFKTPGHVSPEASYAAVSSHEQEHVSREQGKAQDEKRVVVSQSVQVYTDTCPECGKVYISGGKTTTVTKGDSSGDYFARQMKQFLEGHFGKYVDTKI